MNVASLTAVLSPIEGIAMGNEAVVELIFILDISTTHWCTQEVLVGFEPKNFWLAGRCMDRLGL